jgi:hypothetical protein
MHCPPDCRIILELLRSSADNALLEIGPTSIKFLKLKTVKVSETGLEPAGSEVEEFHGGKVEDILLSRMVSYAGFFDAPSLIEANISGTREVRDAAWSVG